MSDGAHPVTFAVDYPDRPLDRLTTALRILTAIPILIVIATVSGGSFDWTEGDTRTTVVSAGGLLFLGPLLMILFRERYPRWWFDWNLQLLRFGARVGDLPRTARRSLSLDRRRAGGPPRGRLARRRSR